VKALDLQWVAAKEPTCGGFVNIGFRRARAEEGLAETDHAFVGAEAQLQEIGEFIKENGFDARDFHSVAPLSSIS